MKKNILLFIFLLFCFNIYAQSKYKAGVIVRNDTDTINGFIHSGVNTNKHCFFKKNLNDDPIQFEPSQLISFQFYGGDKYMTIDHLDKNNISVQSFALVLEEGHVNLYYHKNIYYVQKQKGNIIKLENNEIEVKVNDRIYKKMTRKYIGILLYILSDYPQLRTQVSRVNYSGKEMSKLINKYNSKFNSSEQQYKSKIPWNKLEFGAYLSTSISRPEFSLGSEVLLNHLSNGDWGFSPQLGCGFFIENRYMRISKNWALHLEGQLERSKHSSTAEIVNSNTKYIYDNKLEHYILNVPIGLKYYKKYQNITAYVMGGAYYQRTFAHNDKTVGIRIKSNDILILPEVKAYELESNNLGFWLSMGLRKKLKNKLDLFSEIRYYQNKSKVNSPVINTYFKTEQKNISIGLHVGLYF